MDTTIRPRVFLASTVRDLQGYRDIATDEIKELGFHPETVGPLDGLTDEEIVRICQEKVRSCDVCILILGFSKGGTPQIDGAGDASFTSPEIKAAEEVGIPVLGFLVKEYQNEAEAYTQWVKEFRNRQMEVRIINFIQSEFDLRTGVSTSLLQWSKTSHITKP